ncbi:MarR family transcriptional regulator [uncultured Brevundimonas sp.]|uniref:MarR family winged helix-turn-helix transcriptional regulator n=1 Tax=uncultured Brevundimonas sp. TaxID=213418 RepID=UPI0025CC2E97|nr:MarR family transcriptional regulator [uncultured Brevundimonas sp.]
MTASQTVPLDNQLCFSIYSAAIAINRAYKPLLDQLGVTYPQYLVLSTLWEAGGQTIGGIADRLDLEPSTITPLVKRLEAAGLVQRQRNPADERQVIVDLTDQGRALQSRAGCLLDELLRRSGLSAQELTALNDQVRALKTAICSDKPHGVD